MDTKQGKSAIDVINGLQDLPPAYYRMVVDALRDAVGCALCGGNDHNADECKRFAGELLPCPFCGDASPSLTHDDYIHENGEPMAVVECTNCHTWVQAAAWNRRAAQPAPVVPEGWSARLIKDGDDIGYVVSTPRDETGARSNTSVWADDNDPAHAMLWHMLAAAPAQGQQVECDTCNGQGEVWTGETQHFPAWDMQPPEPIMETCPECSGESAQIQHPDDAAVDRFAAAMKAKLAKSREKGRGGWEDKAQCSAEYLSELLRGHVEKGDPVDVANFCMMLQQRGEGIQATDSECEKLGKANEKLCARIKELKAQLEAKAQGGEA